MERKPISIPRLQQYAIAISVISIIYNGAEGAVSIGFGSENSSNSLIFFGIQSVIEVVSAGLVLWRFTKVARPGEEQTAKIQPAMLKKERSATIGIGILLAILAVGTWTTSIFSLIRHDRPQTATPSLIISASALGIMILIWAPKPWLAKALNSSAMHGEAKCSLACIYMTGVLLGGTLIYKFWKGGWWVDSATALLLGLFFARDATEMIRWGLSEQFSGGCCGSCQPVEQSAADRATACAQAGPCCERPSCVQSQISADQKAVESTQSCTHRTADGPVIACCSKGCSV
jgi:divalent metal cation (Fe/Co/Zn/Cd) transporter